MYKNILVPVVVDDSRDTDAALRIATKLADAIAKFAVVHVMESIPSYAAVEIPPEVIARSEAEAQAALADVARKLPGADPVILHGHAGRAIVEHARSRGVDLIVLASHRPGFRDHFIGSTADWVVRHAACSVHVVR